jgi:Fe-Mn family superoxide dismutase
MPYPFQLPALPYPFDALEPHIDARTMEIHHDKHHAAYTTNLNKALEKYPDFQKQDIETLLRGIKTIPEDIRKVVQNNGGGYANHDMFWKVMSPDGGGDPKKGALADAINAAFGSINDLKEKVNAAAVGQFGSGWGWLVANAAGELKVYGTANQDSPYMTGDTPLLGVDVWEHAYYLKYQNRRPDYVKEWWNTVNWAEVEKRFASLATK